MAAIGVDNGGIERMLAKAGNLNILLEQLSCGAANILKQEMLGLGGDAAVARGTVCCSVAHSDVMLMGTYKQLRALARKLAAQPFGLARVGTELGALLEKRNRGITAMVGRNAELSLQRPCVMGILNVTPDSFHDGGTCANLDDLLFRAEEQVKGGVDLFDVGGESTRPGAAAVDLSTELDRVVPVVEALQQEFDTPISVDTTKAEVARQTLMSGAAFINDISGLTFDPDMAQVVATYGAGVFIMHTSARPDVMQQITDYADLMGEVIKALKVSVARAGDAGVADECIALDPGIGFGKDLAGNLTLIQRLREIVDVGYPVLLGTSRKSFIGKVLEQPQTAQRLAGSLATVALGVANGAKIFRVHDVAQTRQAVDMAWAVCSNA